MMRTRDPRRMLPFSSPGGASGGINGGCLAAKLNATYPKFVALV
jgi:hypothetical protein